MLTEPILLKGNYFTTLAAKAQLAVGFVYHGKYLHKVVPLAFVLCGERREFSFLFFFFFTNQGQWCKQTQILVWASLASVWIVLKCLNRSSKYSGCLRKEPHQYLTSISASALSDASIGCTFPVRDSSAENLSKVQQWNLLSWSPVIDFLYTFHIMLCLAWLSLMGELSMQRWTF